MIDLHTHSLRSDGSESPTRVVELASQAGLQAVALTDHDTVDGLAEAGTRANDLGLRFVPGIELSCHTSDRTLHLLGYFVDATNGPLRDMLQQQQLSRANRNELLAARLQELGKEVTLEEVLAHAGDATVGRPHFAKVLVEKGYATSIDHAFSEYLSPGRPADIQRRELTAVDAIHTIVSAGGVAVWAHPWFGRTFDETLLRSALDELCDAGLGGLEAWYSRYSADNRRRMVRLARRFDLIPTGGSDFHGTYKPDIAIGIGTGDLRVPDEIVDELFECSTNSR